jgi:hypothetical protein
MCHYYHQIVVFNSRIYQDVGPNDLCQGNTCAAQIIHGADCATEGLAQGKAATDGVWIGIPVAEVEDISV